MGDGPDGRYHFCRIGRAQGDGMYCGSGGWPRRRSTTTRGFENRPEILSKLASWLSKGGRRLSFCYEAGPCGYGLHRLLTGYGHECVVIAPSLIPMKAGDRVKTDRRDA